MAYEQTGSRVLEVVLKLTLGLFLLIMGVILVTSLQNIYNSEVPTQLKGVTEFYSNTKIESLKYKDLLNYYNSLAFKIALWVAKAVKFIASLF